jgi:type IX secretion system PorP/SprF family membrane protein
MDKNNHIDDIFRSKLRNYKPEYVPEHWQMMKAAISSSAKDIPATSSFTARLLIVISALIILSSGIYTYLLTQNNNSSQIKNTATLNNTTKNPVSISNNIAFNSQPVKSSSSDLASNNTLQNQTNLINKNDGQPKTSEKTGNFRKNQVAEDNSSLKNTSGNVPNNSVVINNDKPLVNNTDIALLSGKDITENKLIPKIDENTVVDKQNIESTEVKDEKIPVAINSDEQPQNSGSVVDVQKTNKKTDVTSSEKGDIENSNYTSITDDYLSQKQKQDKKHNKSSDFKATKKMIAELIPDNNVSMVNNFVINPAYAGLYQRHTISLSTLIHKPLYKPSNYFNVPFEYSIAYDFSFGKRKNYGIGIDYKRYLGAAEGSLSVDVTFAYRIFLAEHHNLRIGISASFLGSDINKSNLTFPDMIDPRTGFVYNTNESFPDKTFKNNFDLGMGVWYSWKTLYVSLSAIHLTSPEIGVISKAKIPREYMLSAGYGFNLGKQFNILPAVELNYSSKILNINPDLLFTYRRWLLFGVEFQNLRTAGLVLGFNIKNDVIINLHGGIPMRKDIITNFGAIDYAGIGLRFQFGNYR